MTNLGNETIIQVTKGSKEKIESGIVPPSSGLLPAECNSEFPMSDCVFVLSSRAQHAASKKVMTIRS
ncbi:unnamed protein product [Schistosoma spindalis]|nr:unnamed protein product [Schistosoma spindale]